MKLIPYIGYKVLHITHTNSDTMSWRQIVSESPSEQNTCCIPKN